MTAERAQIMSDGSCQQPHALPTYKQRHDAAVMAGVQEQLGERVRHCLQRRPVTGGQGCLQQWRDGHKWDPPLPPPPSSRPMGRHSPAHALAAPYRRIIALHQHAQQPARGQAQALASPALAAPAPPPPCFLAAHPAAGPWTGAAPRAPPRRPGWGRRRWRTPGWPAGGGVWLVRGFYSGPQDGVGCAC